MVRAATKWGVVALVIWTLAGIATAAEKPDMTHLWRLTKTSWGACWGNPTHFMTTSQSECNVAKSIGYEGNCSTGNYDAEHYVSSVSFPNSVTVYRLSKGGTCNCKDTFIYTPSSYWKNHFTNQGYNVESGKEYYAWDSGIGNLNTINDWGLVPVYHAHSSALCDNFYTEHPDQYNNKLASGYTAGFETNPTAVAYYAADGWIDLQVQCSEPGCSWKLTGPGGWSVNKSGNYTFPSHSLPSHGYRLQCNSISGMVTKDADQSPYFSFFTSNVLKCEYSCDNECSFNGQKQCNGNGYRTCQSNASGCLTWSNVVSCDDNDPCTTGDGCVNGNCVQGTPKDCAYLSDTCNTGLCSNGQCTQQPKGGACDDGNPCTTADQCNNGSCVGTPMDCAYLNDDCNLGVCQNGQCVKQLLPGSCDDGIACTVDSCDEANGCQHGASNALCDDGNPCTADTCSLVLDCQHESVDGGCDNGDPCTVGDTCQEGLCVAGTPKTCDDANDCTADSCDPQTGNCVQEPLDIPCDDGNACTINDSCKPGLCTGELLPDCCATIDDCPDPGQECLSVACIGGQCKETAFCLEGQCGISPCDANLVCNNCLAIEVCIEGWCQEECGPEDKEMTRCTNDGKTLEKCVQDEASGLYFWKATDCGALGEAGCAFSQDKGINVCCTPDCDAKACGTPSACGISCGTCAEAEYCCAADDACADESVENLFQCIDCCAGMECGLSTVGGCSEQCGTCPDGKTCKDGSCVSGCEDANVDAEGMCAGTVAWWCEEVMGQEVLKELDCAEYVATCCFDDALGRVGCCDCQQECADNNWACGTNSCGEPCGDYDGECAPGFNCIPETHQCLCQMPELCYPDVATDVTGSQDATGGFTVVVDDDTPGGGDKSGTCSTGQRPTFGALLLLALLLGLVVQRRYFTGT